MTPSPPQHTDKEQQARQLWQGYQRGNNAEFWQQYEKLLSKPQDKPNENTKTLVFRPANQSYLWRILFALFVWILIIAVLMNILPWDQPVSRPLSNEGDFYVFFVIIGCFVAMLPWLHLKDLYVWRVSATKLTVTRWGVKMQDFDLQAIRLVEVKVNPNRGGASAQKLVLHLGDNETVEFNYCLGLDQHWAFFYALHQQGVTTKCTSNIYKIRFELY